MQSEPLRLTYTLTPDMIAEGMMAVSMRGVSGTRQPGPLRVVLGWLALVAVMVASWQLLEAYPVALMMVVGVIGVVIGALSVLRLVRRTTEQMVEGIAATKAAEGPHRLEITRTHVREATDATQHQVALRQVTEVLRIEGASVLVANGFGFVVPDGALPPAMPPERLAELINWWREEGET